VALGAMVGNLTVGKKKYADVEEDMRADREKAEAIRLEMLRLIDGDAEAFEPLSKAYGIPKDDPTRAETMEKCLRDACGVPMDIMRTACKAIDLIADFAAKGSALAISDAGVGVVFCKAALQGASLNVFINTKAMADKAYAAEIEAEADGLLTKYCAMADEIYAKVTGKLRG
ncbi:MAG: cyclodeaminase/cyclohydrolase family protein, partial [Oscillospiraceae bacterium]|nr:cyclodeaminase/cyclohydrolase family protein [Oscillospiraceae bacterium]